MPPVRWKLSVTIVFCLQLVLNADAQFRQEEISVDGWRPIIGTRKPHFYSYSSSPSNDFYKYEVYSTPPPSLMSPTVTSSPSRKPHFRGSTKPHYASGRKVPHQKHYHPDPFFALPSHGNHGPHIPIGAVVHTRPSQVGHIKPHATTSKPFIQMSSTTSKRNIKPVRIQTSTSSYRDEIFTASATSGVYNHYKPSPSNIRTRETIDLGIPGANNHYSINQPHAHIEFNRFSLTPTSESVFEQYNNPSVSPFIFGKHPQTNDIDFQIQNHNNDFTRNLIPSPQIYKNKDYITRDRPNIQENVVLQVPPPIQYTQQKINEPVQVHVTKEKLHEFHNNVPPNYHGQYIEYDFSKVRKPTEAPKPVYEVTESLLWQEPPSKRPVRTRKPTQPKRRPEIIDDVVPVFLPTPYKPEKQGVEPTSPTQSEVSTIFSKLSNLQKEKAFTTSNPFDFSVKEVSTHYPVFGKPVFGDVQSSKEISNEITTHHEDIVTTTREPQRIRPQRRRRPDRRTTTTTTTEQPQVYTVYQTQENENAQLVETERPSRLRRPTRYRTTTPSSSEEIVKIHRGRNRFRHRNPENFNYEPTKIKQRPSRLETTTHLPENHRDEYHRESSQSSSFENDEAASEKSEEIEESPKAEDVEVELPARQYFEKPEDSDHHETIKPFIILTTTEKVPTTNLVIPEKDEEVTAIPNIEDTTTTTTAASTTTTTTSPHRIKKRPLKFDNSHRPRFSVKDYRQKLNLQSSTSSPQVHRSTESPRIRIPGRLRRPSTTTPVTNEEENIETVRHKFVPKDARHSATTEATNIITEKNVKSINTRLRPFGRYKSTTASTTTTTTTPRVSIKSNLFNRKRPPMISLRNKIFNKNKNNTETTTERATTTEGNEVTDSTPEYDHEIEVDSTTEPNWKFVSSTEDYDDAETTTTVDLSKIDPYFYSQRVSDLTSSAKNDYNTPGLFKSVSPTSRRIPNYFTISTDDPILPLEAFFSNIKDKIRDKDP